MKSRLKILAAKVGLLIACHANAGGMPVIDAANLQQATMSAIEAVNQTAKQAEEYALQLQQYEDQLRNTMAPSAYLWDRANQTMNRMLGLMDTMNYYRQMAGSLNSYLYKFQDAGYYRQSPCFGPSGCSTADMEKVRQSDWEGSTAQKKANDAMLRGLEEQQNQLDIDSRNLERLQSQAQGAQGRMEALQAANQIASNQAAQLLQLRTLLVQQQAAEAARAQAIADREAKELAGHEQATADTVTVKQGQKW
jgi:P-type conjugative transfer protein TrbJ